MHARGTKFAWRVGQARAFVASSKASRRCSRSAPTPTRRQIHGAGAGCTTLSTVLELEGPYLPIPRMAQSWSHPAIPFIAGVYRSVGGALGHAEYEPMQAAEKERVRAPSNGMHLPHCCWPETKLRDRLSMRSVGVQRRVWCDGVHPTAGAARATMGMRRGSAVMRAAFAGTEVSPRTMERFAGDGGGRFQWSISTVRCVARGGIQCTPDLQ